MQLGDDEFLVCYDYGMGGLWAIVAAPSEAAILALYPEVGIAHERPEWMDDEDLARMRERSFYRLDEDPPRGSIFFVVLDDRTRRKPTGR